MKFAGLKMGVPDDFHIDQTMISFRAPAPSAASRALQKQTGIRPSFIVNRRAVPEGSSLGILAGELTAELMTGIPGLNGLTTESFRYADGQEGIIIGFEFTQVGTGNLRQYHAMRLDGPLATTLTLTIDKLTLNDATKQKWLSLLASVVPDGEGEQP